VDEGTKQVSEGVAQAEHARDSLKDILSAVGDVADQIGQISASAQ
jgi:methyl-accepting chemotaxis protein